MICRGVGVVAFSLVVLLWIPWVCSAGWSYFIVLLVVGVAFAVFWFPSIFVPFCFGVFLLSSTLVLFFSVLAF